MNIIKNYIYKFKDPKDPAARLTMISFTLIFCAAIIIGSFLSYYLSYQLQKHYANTTSHLIKQYVKERFKETDFIAKEKKIDSSNRYFSDSLLQMKSLLQIVGLSIFDASGKLIWADEGLKRAGEITDIEEALNGEIDYGFARIPTNGKKKVFYVTVPVSFAGTDEVTAVFEVMMSHYDFSKNTLIGWIIIWLFSIIGGAIIYFMFTGAIRRTYQQNLVLQHELIQYSQELESNIQVITDVQNVAILGLSKLAEYRDKETGQHLERMSLYSRMLAEELSMWDGYKFYITKYYVDSIFTSAVLHDIGKVGIPDHVLLKPGKLNPEEWEIMKKHTTIGGDALKAADRQLGIESFMTIGKEVAYFHHEKYNGAGYPNGLKGEDIPLSARIVAFADVFDALTSKRVYKPAFDFDKTKKILLASRGEHFAPDLVDAFLKIESTFLEVADKFKN